MDKQTNSVEDVIYASQLDESSEEQSKKYLDLEGLKFYDAQIKKLIKSQVLEWEDLGGGE